jgi:putative SOS response-associated peptidase YedK
MCGRYAASRGADDLVEEFELVDPGAVERARTDAVEADFNVAPTKTAPVVLERPPGHDRDADPVRQLRPLVWGLVPSWAKDSSVGARMVNARAETLLDKPAYRRAAVSRRCLVPADGWYEWQAIPSGTHGRGKPRKQPFFVTGAGGHGVALAGLYEFWRDGARDPEDPQARLTTFAIVTTAAERDLERVHDRMPLALPRARWDAWLSPAVTHEDEVRALLQPQEPGGFVAVPVSTLVNDVRNSSSDLVRPLSDGDLVGAVDPASGEALGVDDVLFR